MVPAVAGLLLAGALMVAAGAKLADPRGARGALATYGLHGRAAAMALGALVVSEVVLAIAVGAGVAGAAWLAAGLMAAFAVAQGVALAAGRGGAPCACLGARGRVGAASIARAAVLAAAFAAVAVAPRRPLSGEEWMAIGLVVALLGLVVLGVVVLALAREVGELRLAADPRGALEIPHEGPELGGRTALAERFTGLGPARLGLAVFTSEGCAVCRGLEPAVAAFARDPLVEVRAFDEVRDADAWALADVPGSPFAVALDADGTVLAKGTFNTGAQLESVLAAAERRRGALRT